MGTVRDGSQKQPDEQTTTPDESTEDTGTVEPTVPEDETDEKTNDDGTRRQPRR